MTPRYRVLYRPGGPALEYNPWGLNHAIGCPHACIYCYGPGQFHMKRQDFHRGIRIKDDILAKVAADALLFMQYNPGEPVLLAFGTDPYAPGLAGHTHQVIKILTDHMIPVHVLTKGVMPMKDMELLARVPGSAVAVTITSLDEDLTDKWEPHAAYPSMRLGNLIRAQRYDLATWLSLEPVYDPDAAIGVISCCAPFAHEIRVGKLSKPGALPEWAKEQVKDIEWAKFRDDAVALLEARSCRYQIKESLLNA